jgi:hypothetical protein
MSLTIKISEKEINDCSNDTELGSYVRNKYLEFKSVSHEDDVLSMGQIPDYNSYDKCVICGKESPYKVSTHIDMRNGYVEGVGQTCFNPKECEK